jgi:PIN domain nuclease of toxin-antitoxin system
MTATVLDASALLAMLREESGAARVAPLLAEGVVASVNLCEVIQHYARHGATESEIRERLTPLSFTTVPFDEALAYEAGMLIVATQGAGLSLGDRACLALARRLSVKAVTADRAWTRIAATVGVEVELIR